MPRLSPSHYLLLMLLSFGIWAALAVLCVFVGTNGVGLPLTPSGAIDADIFAFRRQIVLHASLVGAGLAGAGVVYQALLRNPLADPYLLGVASGATLGATLWKLPGFVLVPVLAAAGQQGAALVGALGAVALVFAVASRRGRLEPITLLLTGVIVSALCSAVLTLIEAVQPELLAGVGGLRSILIGGIQTNLAQWQFTLAAWVILSGLMGLGLLSASLAVATLSDTEAGSLGVSLNRLRWLALTLASVVVASAVAISGPIGFVGLIAPHLARMLVGPDPRKTLPVAIALGAALLATADAVCRLLAQPQYLATLLPAGVLTAMLGAPFFLLLLVRSRSAEQ